jgi:hypothetical protein
VNPPSPNLQAPAATVVPADVCIPNPPPGGVPFRYFDDYSWRTFIALVWPAQAGQRGVPDTGQTIAANKGPVVFETYKSDWETFQPNAGKPSDWSSFGPSNPSGPPNPCSNTKDVARGDLVLGSFNEFGNVGEAGIKKFVTVLVAQNGSYVRYLAAYNRTEFEQILNQGLYLAANVPPITAPSPSNPRGSTWIA